MNTPLERNTTSPMLRHAYDYWNRKRADSAMPSRRNIRPEELGLLLRSSYLVNVLENPLDFEFRAIGSDIVDALGVDYSRQRLSQITWTPWFGERIRQELSEVVTTKRPAQHAHRFLSVARFRNVAFERLSLPLTTDGQTVSHILCIRHDQAHVRATSTIQHAVA